MDEQENKPKDLFLGQHENVSSFSQSSLQIIAKAIGSSNTLPSEKKEDWTFYSTFPGFRQVMAAEKSHIRAMMEKLLKFNGIRASKLAPNASPSDLIEFLSDANDQILERVNSNLDEAAGMKKDLVLIEVKRDMTAGAPARLSGSWNNRHHQNNDDRDQLKLITAKGILRPQMNFKIDNSPKPFMPKLKEKPNSKKPLSILVEHDEFGEEYYSHPYVYELNMFQPDLENLRAKIDEDTGLPLKVEEAPVTFIDTKEKLEKLIGTLKDEKEIAVDLEHHWYRSFLGITSLIQISTWDKDFIVDPYPLWNDLTVLNEIFTDPKICKVLHGADNDLMWLQRDFSVYMVNMFDTHQAAVTLNFPAGSRRFSSLLHRYCEVQTDKQFQLADWRIRPLPSEMVDYARNDTRHLLYIARQMKKTLLKEGNEFDNLLLSTLNNCTDMCKRIYTKPRLREESHMELLRKSRANFNSRQQFAAKHIFEWRNKTAREEDESEQFVLPNHMLLKICTELPREMQGILACCNPIPPLVKQNLHALHMIILKAREQPLTVIKHDIENNPESNANRFVESMLSNPAEDPLKTPLDLRHLADLDGRTLLENLSVEKKVQSSIIKLKSKPQISVFASPKSTSEEKNEKVLEFVGPYQRYHMLMPYLKHLEETKEEDREVNIAHADQVRSIREHFDALTAMTAEEYTAEEERGEKNKEEEGQVEEEEEEEVQVIEEEVENGDVRPLRKAEKNFNRKRKHNMKNVTQGSVTNHQQSSDNFEQFSKDKKSRNSGPSENIYNPWKDYNKHTKGAKKPKQKFSKNHGKSHTFKKK